jgi:hypothetical protein
MVKRGHCLFRRYVRRIEPRAAQLSAQVHLPPSYRVTQHLYYRNVITDSGYKSWNALRVWCWSTPAWRPFLKPRESEKGHDGILLVSSRSRAANFLSVGRCSRCSRPSTWSEKAPWSPGVYDEWSQRMIPCAPTSLSCGWQRCRRALYIRARYPNLGRRCVFWSGVHRCRRSKETLCRGPSVCADVVRTSDVSQYGRVCTSCSCIGSR